MQTAPYATVVLAIWALWGLSWLAAWGWTGRTQGTAGAGPQSPYRIVNLAGWIMLFCDGALRPTPAGLHWQPFLPRLWQAPAWLGWAMVALILIGLAFAWSARITLGRLWSAAVTRKEGHRIVDTGPYAFVRHPIYTGILMGAIAAAVVKGTPITLAGLVLMTIGYHMKARLEERFLAAELGARDYADYVRRVPMLVPFGPH